MMYRTTQLKTFVFYLVVGVIATLLLGVFHYSSMFSPSATAQIPIANPEPLPADFKPLSVSDFPIDPAAYIPPGLEQSDNPAQASRGQPGIDDRVPMTSDDYPWSAIGRITSYYADGTAGYCTGTLVATDIVLTNAHCVVDSNTGELSVAIQFEPNLVNGLLQNDEDAAWAVDVEYGAGYLDDPQPPSADDWAFFRLDKPLGDTYGTIPLIPLTVSQLANDFDGQLILVGYSGDFPEDNPGETASAHIGCSILGEIEDSLIHDCDSSGGASGGPILGSVDGQPSVVALHKGGRSVEYQGRDDNTPISVDVVNYATKISRILAAIQE